MDIKADSIIGRDDIAQTERLIRSHIRRTPVMEVDAADFGLAAARLSFKLELLQHAGSFKTRGAFTNLLTREIPKAGVVAASGGNPGVAVAYASMKLGIPAKIFVPTISSPSKIQKIRDYRAELVVTGDRYADALAASKVWAEQSGALSIHAYDQRETLLGQGTVGLEIEEQSWDINLLLVAVGGRWANRRHCGLGLALRSGWLASNQKPLQRLRWRSKPEDRSMRRLVVSRRIHPHHAGWGLSFTPSPSSM